MTTALPARCRWVPDASGGAVVRRSAAEALVATATVTVAVVACGLAVGFAADEGFWTPGFLGFVGVFGLGELVAMNYLFERHELVVVGDGEVRHRWRRPVGGTRSERVSGLRVLSRRAGGGVGEHWEFGVDHADTGATAGLLWVDEPATLRRLGEALRERTGLPFDPEPRT